MANIVACVCYPKEDKRAYSLLRALKWQLTSGLPTYKLVALFYYFKCGR